jgi:hypothetical protein
VEINNIQTLLDVIADFGKNNPDKQLFFRGQQKSFVSILPSIGRDGYLQNEDHLFREFITRNPDEFASSMSTFDKLVKMQHYNLPTRLLDVTSNPLVALFFATEEDEKYDDADGEFIIYGIPRDKIKFYDSDTVSVISNIAKRPCDGLNISDVDYDTEMDHDLDRFNKLSDIVYLLHEIRFEKPHFKSLIKKKHLESIYCVKALLNNRRIINQDGAFLIFGIDQSKENLATYEANDIKPERYIVKDKETIRKSLGSIGITYDKIYPELDTTAEFLRKKYNGLRQQSIRPETNKPSQAAVFQPARHRK